MRSISVAIVDNAGKIAGGLAKKTLVFNSIASKTVRGKLTTTKLHNRHHTNYFVLYGPMCLFAVYCSS